jgi:hypothetical protein
MKTPAGFPGLSDADRQSAALWPRLFWRRLNKAGKPISFPSHEHRFRTPGWVIGFIFISRTFLAFLQIRPMAYDERHSSAAALAPRDFRERL